MLSEGDAVGGDVPLVRPRMEALVPEGVAMGMELAFVNKTMTFVPAFLAETSHTTTYPMASVLPIDNIFTITQRFTRTSLVRSEFPAISELGRRQEYTRRE